MTPTQPASTSNTLDPTKIRMLAAIIASPPPPQSFNDAPFLTAMRQFLSRRPFRASDGRRLIGF